MKNPDRLWKCARFLSAAVFIIIGTSLLFAGEVKMDTNVPYGWCIVKEGRRSSSGTQQVMTGGNNGRVVRAGTRADFDYLCQSPEPLVIMAANVEYGNIALAANKTLIGNVQLGGGPGSSARSIRAGSNTIIRNFNIKGSPDGIAIKSQSHVWIDHCTFYKAGDEQVSVTYGSDKITFSWCKFTDNQVKVMLVNNGKKNSSEEKRNNLTISHCFFDGTDQRNPRLGYGWLHVLNSYYKSCGKINPSFGYGIHVYWGARGTVEGCNFVDTKDAASSHLPNKNAPGHLHYIDNIRDSISKFAPAETDPNKIFIPSRWYLYDWAKIDAKDVPEIVGTKAGVGAEFSSLGLLPTPGQGAVNVSTSPTLSWTRAGSKKNSTVYFGKTFPPPKAGTANGNSFKPGNLDRGTVYYWRVNDNDAWVFRTEGTPVATRHAITSKKSVPKAAKYKKSIQGVSAGFIGIEETGADGKLYHLNGQAVKNRDAVKNSNGLK